MRRSGLLAGCVYGQTVEMSQVMSVPVLRGSQCSLLRCEITKAPWLCGSLGIRIINHTNSLYTHLDNPEMRAQPLWGPSFEFLTDLHCFCTNIFLLLLSTQVESLAHYYNVQDNEGAIDNSGSGTVPTPTTVASGRGISSSWRQPFSKTMPWSLFPCFLCSCQTAVDSNSPLTVACHHHEQDKYLMCWLFLLCWA